MHCGKCLTIIRNVKKVMRTDGTEALYHHLKYICANKSSLHPYNGQRRYSVNLVDTLVRRQLQAALFCDAIRSSDISIHAVIQQQDELKQKSEQE